MVPPPYTAEPGHWFLRGVQSAIFYYVSFTPCLEYQHKRKRRKEAKVHAEIVTTQPGLVRQPGPFQTNETWAEELMLGPGPPKGWKADQLLQKLKRSDTTDSLEKPHKPEAPENPSLQLRPTLSSVVVSRHATQNSTRPSSSDSEGAPSEAQDDKSNASQSRPSMDRRLSTAMENIKDSLRITLHPEKWNWTRYEREDEVLRGFGERMTRMWNRATAGVHLDGEDEHEAGVPPRWRKRATTMESDQYDYRRARNPALNELHPPVVSQLPATKDEAAWMMLPPPSAAVMAGKKRPGAETEMRWPLAVIGRSLTPSGPAREPLATTYSREALDSDNDDRESGESNTELETASVDYVTTEKADVDPRSKMIKHMSDPIVRPSRTYAKDAFTDGRPGLERRRSWQLHYYIQSEQST